MNIKRMLLIGTILVSSLAILPVQEVIAKEGQTAQTEHMKKGKKHPMMRQFKKMAKHLALTDEQKTQVKAIFEQTKLKAKEQKETMKGFKEQVKSLMSAPTFDEKAFIELHSQYQTSFTEMALQKAKSKHAIMQVLTAEQREKFMKFNRKHRR
ncbi:Spy/CpxP family protein refolding chaperone [Thalassotalea sp. SU-HH00458]|uniref:Spy/CpxP family protein refolding chaperone n=1 Tax=Thalassotalea sp. SU-HH00458 TaxID=3127657 RepID=UPI003109A473